MVRARSVYKNSVRSFNYEQDNIKTHKLLSARFSNAIEYWRMLKECNVPKGPKSISLYTFSEYFRAINNPDSLFFKQTKM